MEDFNIEISKGTDYSHTFSLKEPSTNLPLDLTGYSFEFKAKVPGYNAFTDPQPYSLSYSTTAGTITVSATAGLVHISIPKTATDPLLYDTGEYVLFGTTPALAGAKTSVTARGLFTINSSLV